MHSERSVYSDRLTGIEVTRLTDYKGHSHHLYFTNPGWYDQGRRLLFSSDRDNRTNLHGVDLTSGEIEALTDLPPSPPPSETSFLSVCVNSCCDEAYYRHGAGLFALDLHTGSSRQIYRFEPGWCLHMINCDAGGRQIYFAMFADEDARIERGLNRGEVTFEEVWASRPLSRIVRVNCDGSSSTVVHEEPCWIGHANTSPTQAGLLSFCYEGPWDKVGQRIWIMDVSSGDIWPARPVEEGEKIGHEYWYADGVRLGYHGLKASGVPLIGNIRFDNTEQHDDIFPGSGYTGHVFSLDERLIVGDGEGVIKLWRWQGDHYSTPRVLCRHDSGSRIQQTHPHPRISPAGDYVVFTSDRSGYGNLYQVPLVDFDSLPSV